MSAPKPMDDNDLHRAGERPDPFEDGMEDAPRPNGATRMLQSRAELFTLGDLEEAERRDLLSLAELPEGHGWGAELDRMLGGGLAPGMLVALGASRAGAGKTAFLMQLADGLALRCAELTENANADSSAPLTPVLILSEMSARDLGFRTLGRLLGKPARLFRSGPAALRQERAFLEDRYNDPDAASKAVETVADLFHRAREEAREGGRLHRIATWQRLGRPGCSGAGMLSALAIEVEDWRAELAAAHGREVWPVVIVDPIQRWQSPGPEVEALNELVETLDALADQHGWIAFVTSDTNKDAAKVATVRKSNEPERLASPALFRGSYKLHHTADVVMVIQPMMVEVRGERESWAAVALDKNRWGPIDDRAFFRWDRPSGRFEPIPEAEVPFDVRTAFDGKSEDREAEGGSGRRSRKGEGGGATPNDNEANKAAIFRAAWGEE